MKLGLFDHMQKHDRPALSYVELYKNHLEVVECADQAGMDFYFVAEHHFDMGFSECPSPGSFLGAASQRTKRIRLGPLVYVLPLWNPIRVAEEVALLDNLTEGRLECGFGAGIGPFSFAAYNIPWEQKREMTLEALQIIRGIWTHESFTFEGRYFKCKDVDLSIPLVQKPHPPLWMPTRSKDSIEEAARQRHQHDPVGAGWDESRATRFRRVPRSLSTRQACGAETAYRLDARNLRRRNRSRKRAPKVNFTGRISGSGAAARAPTARTDQLDYRRFSTAAAGAN